MLIIIDMEPEEYKYITYPNIQKGRYKISNHGNVIDTETNTFKKTSVNSKNYVHCRLQSEDGKPKTISIHRLVCYEFNPGYDESVGRTLVNHKDTITTHNYFDNLEWTTSSENNFHRFEHGNGSSAKPPIHLGTDHPRNVYDESIIHEICKHLESGMKNTQVMKEYGFKGQNDNKPFYNLIYDIRQRRVWNHISENYNF